MGLRFAEHKISFTFESPHNIWDISQLLLSIYVVEFKINVMCDPSLTGKAKFRGILSLCRVFIAQEAFCFKWFLFWPIQLEINKPTTLITYQLGARKRECYAISHSIHNNNIYHLLRAIFVPSTEPRALRILILKVVLWNLYYEVW